MKKVLSFGLLLIISISICVAQDAAKNMSPVGSWAFDASAAPEGYTTGLVNVSVNAENKYSSYVQFTGSDYKITGEKVKFENDTLSFSVYVEGSIVDISVIFSNAKEIKGKAVYSEGTVPMSFKKATVTAVSN